MPRFTIFYAWQSDHPGNQCRNLIRDAADEAARRLTDDPTIPFDVEIDQDTQDVPGLCDIPATILEKIRTADAFLGDLTFVATSKPVKQEQSPRHCSNPNVLFELGTAFEAIGCERLILVMNENHGPKEDQIFDLDHRRHPIGYNYPDDSRTRAQVVERLADSLDEAFRPIIALGKLDSSAAQPDEALQEELTTLRDELSQLNASGAGDNFFTLCLYPTHDYGERWVGSEELRTVIQSNALRLNMMGGEFPPSTTETKPREWGIANEAYGDPWLLSRTGVFLFKVPMNLDTDTYPSSDRRHSPTSDPPLKSGTWIRLADCRAQMFGLFYFANRLAGEFSPEETIALQIDAPVQGLHLVTEDSLRQVLRKHLEPSVAKTFTFSREIRVSEFQEQWLELCAAAMDRFFDLFPGILGRRLGSMKEWVEETAHRL